MGIGDNVVEICNNFYTIMCNGIANYDFDANVELHTIKYEEGDPDYECQIYLYSNGIELDEPSLYIEIYHCYIPEVKLEILHSSDVFIHSDLPEELIDILQVCAEEFKEANKDG